MIILETIHQWLRKVETASETAINSACSETAALYAKLGKKNPVQAQVKNSNNQNDPYSGNLAFFYFYSFAKLCYFNDIVYWS
jgi:hypothetical protein